MPRSALITGHALENQLWRCELELWESEWEFPCDRGLSDGPDPDGRRGGRTGRREPGSKPPAGAVVLFDGKSLDGWVKVNGKTPAAWPVADGIMTVGESEQGGTIATTQRFGDFQLHVEFNVPYMPAAKGQARGNSGVYLEGIHELQVLDSYGLKPQDNDCGAIYKQVVPPRQRLQAAAPVADLRRDLPQGPGQGRQGREEGPGHRRPERGHDHRRRRDLPTPGGIGGIKEGEDGPLMLQDHHNAVQYRNIWLKPLDGLRLDRAPVRRTGRIGDLATERTGLDPRPWPTPCGNRISPRRPLSAP